MREEAGNRRGRIALKRRKQRNTTLGSHHPGDGVIRSRQLHGMAEIQPLIFQRAQLWREIGERVIIKIGPFGLAVDIDQIELRMRNGFAGSL